MKKHLSKKRVVLAAIVVIALGIASGVAYAYWTSGGTGPGSAVATAPVGTITVNQITSVTGLYPGGNPVTLSGDFNNSNTGAAHIASVTAAVTSVTGSVGSPACTPADFSTGGSFAPTGGIDIPAGNNQVAWTGLTVQLVNNASANQDSCKGATANITYTVH